MPGANARSVLVSGKCFDFFALTISMNFTILFLLSPCSIISASISANVILMFEVFMLLMI